MGKKFKLTTIKPKYLEDKSKPILTGPNILTQPKTILIPRIMKTREELFREYAQVATIPDTFIRLKKISPNDTTITFSDISIDKNYKCNYFHPNQTKWCKDDKCYIGYLYSLAWFINNSDGKIILSSNQDVNPRDISSGSTIKLWFDCPRGKHQFYKQVKILIGSKIHTPNHTGITGCSCRQCSNKYMCYDTECDICPKESFLSLPVSRHWSTEPVEGVYLNGDVKPHHIFPSAKNSYWFKCPNQDCGHTILQEINFLSTKHQKDTNKLKKDPNYVIENPIGCPYCGMSTSGYMCWDPDCQVCYKRSFATYTLNNIKWSDINPVQSREVYLNSSEQFWFDCLKCYHKFKTSPHRIVDKNKNRGENEDTKGCPFCCEKPKKMCDLWDCDPCLQKSLESSFHCTKISTKNNIIPRTIFKKSGAKYIFDCLDCGNEYTASLHHVEDGLKCWNCSTTTEAYLYKWLNNKYPNLFQWGLYAEWCRGLDSNRILPFDIVSDSLKLIVELDGDQHFKQVMNWKSPVEQQRDDIYKMKLAMSPPNNFSIIRLYQPDVYKNINDWDRDLENIINNRIKSMQNNEFYTPWVNYIFHRETKYLPYLEPMSIFENNLTDVKFK